MAKTAGELLVELMIARQKGESEEQLERRRVKVEKQALRQLGEGSTVSVFSVGTKKTPAKRDRN